MPANARLSGPPSVLPGIAPMTQEPVVLSSEARMRTKEGQLPLFQGVICHGAPIPYTSAEYEHIRIAVTIQTAWSGRGERKRVHGSAISLVIPFCHYQLLWFLSTYSKPILINALKVLKQF